MTPEYIEKRLEDYAIKLRSEGVRFDKRKELIARHKEIYFSKENIEAAKKILSVDISGFDPENPLSKPYAPNILERRFRRGSTMTKR